MSDFGTELHRRRLAAGLTLGELARRTHYSKGHLSKVESGGKRPSEQLGRQVDAAVGADGALLALVQRRDRGTGPAPDTSMDGPGPAGQGGGHPAGPGMGAGGGPPLPSPQTWVLELAPDGRGRFAEGIVRSLAGMADGLGVVSFTGTYATAAVDVEGLAAVAGSLRKLGRTLSPAAVLPMTIGLLHTVRVLAGEAHGGDQRALLVLASRVAEFTGWMAQETGDDRTAMWWTEQAVVYAAAGGDETLGEYAQVRRALVALYRGDAGGAVALVAPVRRRSGLPPRVRWLAALREAQGHALAGDHTQAMRLLDTAEAFAARVQPEQSPDLMLGPSTDAHTALVRGWCLVDLGRSAEAAELLAAWLAAMPAGQARARARFGVRLALARAIEGDLDGACRELDGLAEEVRRADSATIRADLRGFGAATRRWQHHPALHDVRTRVRPLLARAG
ncbi:hypothetical protein BL253_24130 [Pseudofrankia asymbiotica]|uniref:HTH cro/C1-type domain-containing protein n=1 Tax=Pseudofrankia asymbiotica TaxID=1834516 RepID=A0A1V2I6E9_9ACTN|nr:hypothetical protein BL253_24130 [Pseudofrankia asymbiotica]